MKPRFQLHAPLFASFGLIVALITSAPPAAAQEVELRQLSPPTADAPAKVHTAADIEVIHVTDRLTNSPDGQQALRNYFEARELGLLPTAKRASSFDIGDEKTFNVLDGLQADDPNWTSRTFILRSTNDVANVWIDKTLSETFSEENLAELDEHMLRSTPESSFRPDRGIIENDNYLFGDPPNYDGDGKLDILLYDIKEGESGSCCVLGYVTSADINPQASANEGNQADVLYVDLPDGIKSGVSGVAWIVAHEYQHLIHYAYQDPPGTELTFVNEGLSEWASVINGYFHRGIRYLSGGSYKAEHSTPLLDWNTAENVNDYERAGLFTTYIAQHIGAEATGSIVQARKPADLGGSFAIGEEGYRATIEENGSTLESVIAGFHAANFINDTSIDPDYGYTIPQRSGIRTLPTTEIDGASMTLFNQIDFSMNPGAAHYFTWSDIANMSIHADIFSNIAEQLRIGQRRRIELRVYVEHVDGRREVATLAPGDDTYAFPGDFSSFTLIVVSTAPYSSSPLRMDLHSSWDESGSSGLVRQTIGFENGTAAGADFYFQLTPEAMLANKFGVPEKGRLGAVYFAPIYDSDFSNTGVPAEAPRDFRVHVWAVDDQGFPAQEIFATDVSESPSSRHIDFSNQAYSFLEVNLPDTSALAQIGDSVFVGVSNIGTDNNYLALAPAIKNTDGVPSYLFLDFENGAGWASFSNITAGGEPVFEDKVIPIRAEFVISTSTDTDTAAELPEQVTLAQNYPNPFNPATSITFSLPKTMQIRLAVYDALGRHVATMVDGVRSAGSHAVQIDAGEWASGVYFYTLETEVRTVSNRMILMK